MEVAPGCAGDPECGDWGRQMDVEQQDTAWWRLKQQDL